MKRKKKIKNDILQILEDSGVAKEDWSKLLTKLVNYVYRIQRAEIDNGDEDGRDDDIRAVVG